MREGEPALGRREEAFKARSRGELASQAVGATIWRKEAQGVDWPALNKEPPPHPRTTRARPRTVAREASDRANLRPWARCISVACSRVGAPGRVERAKPGRRFAPPRLRAWLCCCCTADGTVFCSVKARGGVCRVAMWRSISLPLPFGRVQDVYVTLERYFSRSDLVNQDQLVVCASASRNPLWFLCSGSSCALTRMWELWSVQTRSQKSQASPPGPATEAIGSNALAEETPRRGTGSGVAVLQVVATLLDFADGQ
jgi:hypothetical protein